MTLDPPSQLADTTLVDALRAGDEQAFRELVVALQPTLRRLARAHVPASLVDEVVQETWVGVVTGLDRFEGRASLRTWVVRILLNQARRHGARAARSIPLSAATRGAPAIDPDRLVHPELGRGYWPDAPPAWHTDPERLALDGEVRRLVMATIAGLPEGQQAVITLRDVEGWEAHEVCEALGITAVNQRVLLHRARATVRRQLEEHAHG